MLLRTGDDEGGEDEVFEGNLIYPSDKPSLQQFLNQYKLSQKVASALTENISSVDDLKLLESDNEIKEFVNELGLKFMDRKKLISAITKLQNNASLSNSVIPNKDDKLPLIANNEMESKQINTDDVKEQKYEIIWKEVQIMAKHHQTNRNESKNNDFEQTEETKKNKRSEAPCYIDMMGGLRVVAQKVSSIGQGVPGVGAGSAIVMIFGVGAAASYIAYNNYKQPAYVELKKEYNIRSKLFNDTLSELQKAEASLSDHRNELIKQETLLNSNIFEIDRYGCDTKVIALIGPTGYGKSLICNRLIGNKQDVDDLAGAKNMLFNVAANGMTESETTQLKKKTKAVFMKVMEEERSFILSVVDSPGAYDSNNKDNHYINAMSEFFKASGGVNIFAVVFKFNSKIDANYQKLLKMYQMFWGPQMWKHTVIFVSFCDTDGNKNRKRLSAGISATRTAIKQFLNQVSNGLCDNVSIYEFGEENFEQSIKSLFLMLMVNVDKYKCEGIKAPIDMLTEKIQSLMKKRAKLLSLLQETDKAMKKIESKLPSKLFQHMAKNLQSI